MYPQIVDRLSKVSSVLIEKGLDDIAGRVSQAIDQVKAQEYSLGATRGIEASMDAVAAEMQQLQIIVDGCDEADMEIEEAQRTIKEASVVIEAAKKKKKKWVQDVDVKKGRLTEYKKPGESMEDAAKRALNSDDPSVRGMGAFYFATKKMRKRKKKGKNAGEKGDAKERSRQNPVFDHTDPKVKDNADHFPIDKKDRAYAALSYANHYTEAPDWYDGSLKELKKTVADAVKKAYPDIDVTEESYK